MLLLCDIKMLPQRDNDARRITMLQGYAQGTKYNI